MIALGLAFLLAMTWLGLERYLAGHPDYRLDDALLRSFAALAFPLGDGQATSGSEVRVVQRPAPVGNRIWGYSESPEAFWYCAGPPGHYWLAIAHCERRWLRWRVTWVVRPLTAERLRDALSDDPDALEAAFGAVVINRLYA